MIITLLSWTVIFLLAVSLGTILLRFTVRNLFSDLFSIDLCVVMGILCLNVYAQIYSIFSNVGKEAFCLLLVIGGISAFSGIFYIKSTEKIQINIVHAGWKLGAFFVIVMFTGLCTLKAPNNVDTYLYHAQAIRWIEEYGVVPGLGNLHNRFAYNSAFMPLQALFSFSWILEQPLHSMNGFLGCFFVCYAVMTNKLFTGSESRLSDFLKMVMIIYVYANRNNLSSPGSDISAMLVIIYIFCKWSEYIEKKEWHSQSFGMICLIAVWAVTLKLSAVTCLLLVIYPAVMMIKEKQWKNIWTDVAEGIMIAAPWLIRNIIISGYLLYPYSGIDLFHFDWKMPAQVLDYDRKEIVVWGREVKDVSRYDESIGQWLKTWYENQMLRNKTFIIVGFIATIMVLGLIFIKLIGKWRGKRYISFFLADIREWLLIVAILAGEVFWLFSAPLVRYGMVYLLMPSAVIAFVIKEMIGGERFRKWMLSGIVIVACALFLHRDEDFRLVMPHGYWKIDNLKNDWYGYEIFTSKEGDITGYADFPATTRKDILENILPRGEKIEDGFKPR